jgi:hypothetical protein
MKAFNAGLLAHAFKQLTVYEQHASSTDYPDEEVKREHKEDISLTLAAAKTIAHFINLEETKDAISRLEMDMRSTATKLRTTDLQYALHHLVELMQSELEKRKVFAIDTGKAGYYQDDIYGVLPPPPRLPQHFVRSKQAEPIFGDRVLGAFPSAYMDIVEAGRCLALNRNNAAVYHLMQVAEVGLRVLAKDRRVTITRNKGKVVVPFDFAQWGEMISQLQEKKKLINLWKRSKSLKEEANRYYTRAIFEVDSFNEIFRKHISHSRNELYEPDVALSCWGHVYRFMNTLAERMSEAHTTSNVWSANQKKPQVP